MENNDIIYEVYVDNDEIQQDQLYDSVYVKTIEEAKYIALRLSLYNNISYKYKELNLIGKDSDYFTEDRVCVRAILNYNDKIQDNNTNFYIETVKIEPYIAYNQRMNLGINTSISTNHEYLVSYPHKESNHNPEFIFIYKPDKRLDTYEKVMKEAYTYADFIFGVLIRNDKPFKEFIQKCYDEYNCK